jgi:hypothetical protein
MYSICNKCYEIYNNPKFAQCPKATCAGEVIHIDELMIPSIIALNKKGYPTSTCCSSHEFGVTHTIDMYGATYTWINFKPNVLTLPSIPDGFELNHLGSGNGDGRYVIRLEREQYGSPSPLTFTRQTHLFNGIVNLTKWADSLPERKTENIITFQDVYNAGSKLTNGDKIDIGKNIIIATKVGKNSTDIIGLELRRPKSNVFYDLIFYGDCDDAPPERVMVRIFEGEKIGDTFTIEIGKTIKTMKHFAKSEKVDSVNMIISILTEFINK